jgi:hypothetical protein
MRHRARVMLKRGPTSRSQVGAVSSPDRQSVVRRNFAGTEAFLDLQRTHGNAFVQRLVQRKLAVSQPGDGYKQEAVRVADSVVGNKDASGSTPAISRYAVPGVHRICTECEEEMQRQAAAGNEEAQEEEEKLQCQAGPGEEIVEPQGKAGAGGSISASGEAEAAIRALQGGGQPLLKSVRAYIEPRMGYDFSRVRSHTNRDAARLARSVNALAFTVGGDIVFGAGQYLPKATEGKRLLAHELTQVVQESNHTSYATIQRQEPEEKQTPLEKLDADLVSSWTLDNTIQGDLRALSDSEKQVVLSGTSYRDKLVERLSVGGIRQALGTLGADFDTTRNWLDAAGVKLFNIAYGPDYSRSTPDGTLDAELERRMLEMCQFLILNEMVTEDISLNWAARSKVVAHVKSTAYHIIKGYVTLDDLKKLLTEPAKEKGEGTHTARASLIAGYPNTGWRDRLDQLIAANSELPSIRDRSPDDPRYAWLDIGDVIKIPWATPEDGDAGAQPLREVRDRDDNLWYVEDWNKAETDEQARKNRGIGTGEKLSLAYEGYEVSEPERLPNSLDPTHPPVSSHVYGLAIDATILWSTSTKLPPLAPGWSQSEILDWFKLQRPIMESNPYGPEAAEPWHFEKL